MSFKVCVVFAGLHCVEPAVGVCAVASKGKHYRRVRPMCACWLFHREWLPVAVEESSYYASDSVKSDTL